MKPMIERVDPELLQALGITRANAQSNDFHSNEEILEFRAGYNQDIDQNLAGLPSVEGVDIQEETLESFDGTMIKTRVYRPTGVVGTLPVLLWIHGGGYIVGRAAQDDAIVCNHVKTLNCIAVSVDYRLAPEFPFPTALEDCYSTLKWAVDNAAAQGIDASRIAVYGVSAGGGLAAGLTQIARDRGEIAIMFQMLAYPMLDDRNTIKIADPDNEPLLWTSVKNRAAWTAYLGHEPGTNNTPPYAAPVRTENLEGLPPAYIYVGELDHFLGEDVEYAHRLMQAGVPTELHVYKNSSHGFNFFAPNMSESQRCNAGSFAALSDALKG